ncbi:MAG TPA: DUF1080 domain-containing protein, partial [Gemmataceae bacterium]|nr:DUF1080 domain-containing protein [Gemmataceae bacterium]
PSTNPKPNEIADVAKPFKQMYTGLDLRGWKASEEHKKHYKVRDWGISYDGKCTAADPHLWTEKEYGNFEMVVEWRLPKKSAGGSGILLRGSNKAEVAINSKTPGMKAGAWNRMRILMKDNHVTVYLNNKEILSSEAAPGLPKQGRIGLEHLGDPIDFGNLFIRELSKDE